MEIDVNDNEQLLSHVMLNSEETIDEIVNSKQWKESEVLKAEVSVNGISIPAESFEATLKNFVKQIELNIREKYDADKFDERVREEAKSIARSFTDSLWDEFELAAE